MDPINGITLEKYAELCAKMNDVIKNKDACARIAEREGIKRKDWEAAHKGWQEKIQDINDMGITASHFMPLWRVATEKLTTEKLKRNTQDKPETGGRIRVQG